MPKTYLRVPMSAVVAFFHHEKMDGDLLDFAFDAVKNEVLIETWQPPKTEEEGK